MSGRTVRFALALPAVLIISASLTVSARQGMRAKAAIAGAGITGTVELRELHEQLTPAHDMT